MYPITRYGTGASWAASASTYLNSKDGQRWLREPTPIKILLTCIEITHKVLKL